jgi:CXXX repeat modification system protein
MLSTVVGQVKDEERDEIRALHIRKTGLAELFSTLTGTDAQTLESSPLYDKVVADMGDVSVKFQAWWDRMAAKYKWEKISGKKWRIDFETCDIYLDE